MTQIVTIELVGIAAFALLGYSIWMAARGARN